MIYDADRHEPLQRIEWDEARVALAICKIVADAEERFAPDRYWARHPKDSDGDSAGTLTPLYFGAVGMVWLGAAPLSRDYAQSICRRRSYGRICCGRSGTPATIGSRVSMGRTPRTGTRSTVLSRRHRR